MSELKHKDITEKIIGASFEVHKFLGNGFQEVIYQRALAWEIKQAGLEYAREIEQDIYYKELPEPIGTRRADFVVENKVLVELKAIVKYTGPETQVQVEHKLELPKEFKLLNNIHPSDITARHAAAYLKSRGITEDDILKYGIGYCEKGRYANMVIIPSYDAKGNLNYFTSRGFEEFSRSKYKNPNVSRNIVPFEFFINWNVPIILCEGMFDAIAIKRNAIPLLGKTIQKSLMKRIINSSVEKIYIALDKDAIKQALNFCETLMNEGKEVYLVNLEDKDPSEMGFEKFTNLIQNNLPLTFSNLLEKKLQTL